MVSLSSKIDNQKDFVLSLANDFRKAIDRALEADKLHSTVLASFPRGCCGYTSDLLQRFLGEKGITTKYVSGTYRDCSTIDSQSHAWLELTDGTIVDITGDQFRHKSYPLQNDCPVYCDKPNGFYKRFELDPPCQCEGSFSKDVLRKEQDAYDIICKFL